MDIGVRSVFSGVGQRVFSEFQSTGTGVHWCWGLSDKACPAQEGNL